jgi:T-complex protein 1 subunit zeta
VVVGLDVVSGVPIDPVIEGILDNGCVKKHIMLSASVIASQFLLLVDDVLAAGNANAPKTPNQ